MSSSAPTLELGSLALVCHDRQDAVSSAGGWWCSLPGGLEIALDPCLKCCLI